MNYINQQIDLYPFLSKKQTLNNVFDRIAVSLDWVPKDHRRRLDAYTILAAYTANLATVTRAIEEEGRKELGDANFVCTAMSASVIGDDLRIISPKHPDIEEFFTQWAIDELFFAKLAANEYKSSNLGDQVYRLDYSKRSKRVKVDTIDPGMWFPFNLGLKNEEHNFAWEELNDKGETEIYRARYYRKGGRRERQNRVLLTAGWYKKGAIGKFDDLTLIRYDTDENGKRIQAADLGIDFFPIIYIPNIYREGWDFGESDLTGVYQILDLLSSTYTDEDKNANFMGLIQMWVDRETFDSIPLNAAGNKVIEMGNNKVIPGNAGVVDNSMINESLFEYQHELETKLYTNTNLGHLGSGQSKTGSGDRTTGIFLLKGGPLERFVWIKRLMRQPKYDKLLKYVAQLYLVHGEPEMKKLFAVKGKVDLSKVAHLQFGNILPVDQTALIDNIEKIKNELDDADLKDNLKEAGIVLNKDIVRHESTVKATAPKGIVDKTTKDVKGVK